jgi:hypothetical protein
LLLSFVGGLFGFFALLLFGLVGRLFGFSALFLFGLVGGLLGLGTHSHVLASLGQALTESANA